MSAPGWWLVDESPVSFAVLDDKLRCHELSQCWRSRLGLAADANISLTLDELLGELASAQLTERLRGVIAEGVSVRVDRVAIDGGGAPFIAKLSAWRAEHDDISCLLLAAFDMTEYEESVRVLEEVQTQHELLLDAAGEGIYGLNAEGQLTFGNRASHQILGWEIDPILGKKAHDVHHHSHADGTPYPREECPIYAALKDGEVHRVDNEVFWHTDGSAVPVEYTSTPILKDGEPNGAVVVFRDISRRVEAERQREEAFDEIKALKEQLERERDYLRDEIEVTVHFGEIIGESPALNRTLAKVEAVAGTDANVLVLGESGTGKEMIARAVHANSQRCDKPLIKVNCASIPKELFESEFFGHIKGAFTGAHRDRVGRMQLANGGTLFLDEVGEIPMSLQSKLLRALQEQEFELVGDDKTMQVDVRIVAATNRNLEEEVAAGRFREDLYYRLSVFPIELPPLRERVEDIMPLALKFVSGICKELGRDTLPLTQQHRRMLERHRWPGNVRELRSVIERAVILTRGARLRLDLAMGVPVEPVDRGDAELGPATGFLTEAEFQEREKQNLIAVLTAADWKVWGQDGAASMYGISPSTFAYRMKALGISKNEPS